jgi:hypothetical protein
MSKFILYTYSMSVWAAVPELALYALSLSLSLRLTQLTTRPMISIELGYTEKDVEKKTVNLREGENFNPAFLKIVSSFQNRGPPTF